MLLWMSGCSSFWIASEVFGYSAVQLLTCWCHLKVLPSRRTFCVHHTSIHQFTVSLYSTPHTQGACVFRCNLSFALLAERPGYFACNFGNTGLNVYRNKSQHGRKLTLEKKILSPFLPGLESETFRSQVRHSTTQLSIPADPFMSSWLTLAKITETKYCCCNPSRAFKRFCSHSLLLKMRWFYCRWKGIKQV